MNKRQLMIEVKIINRSKNDLPRYETPQSAGVDLRADIQDEITLQPLERTLINTGLYIALPTGYEAQVRPRSGMAFKHGLTVLNTPGTIDADYRGEIKVIMVNLSNEAYTIKPAERVAQMVIAEHQQALWKQVEVLDETERGEGGFGSTGKA
jgi:dUTP pyrophosphatase